MIPSRVVQLVKRHHLNNPVSALDVGIPLKYLGQGLYRKAYQVVGTDIILKFPSLTPDAKQHSLQEAQAVNNIATKHLSIKKHLPKIYFCDPSTGVVVAKKYKLLPRMSGEGKRNKLAKVVGKTIKQGIWDLDLHYHNVGVDGRGTLKILDAGFFHA